VAARIADALLDARLCACVQTLGPITSRFAWKGRRERGREWLLLIKTRSARVRALGRLVRREHPYEVPEILAVPVVGGDPAYLEWLAAETATRPPAARRGAGSRSGAGPKRRRTRS
jgi:periplasmic divalent cation tolerance protein